MPWFNGLYGPLGYLKEDSYVYTTRNRIVRTNKDVRYFTLFTKYHATKYNYDFVGKKYWLPYKKINGHYFYYIAMAPTSKQETSFQSTACSNTLMVKKPCLRCLVILLHLTVKPRK